MGTAVSPRSRRHAAARNRVKDSFKDVSLDFARTGNSLGTVLPYLHDQGLDTEYLRPWHVQGDNRRFWTRNAGTVQNPDYRTELYTGNASSQLRDNWLMADDVAIQAAKTSLRAVGDLISDGAVMDFDGMAHPVVSWQTVTDITYATVSMWGDLEEGENDKPEFGIAYLPIPIIHKDLMFGARELAVATRGSNPFPIDNDTIAKASRRCAELAEDMLVGNRATFTYQGYSVYGYRTHPSRLTKVLTLPTDGAWTPQTLVTEMLAMRQQLRDKFMPGPYRVYISSNWEPYFDDDYSGAYNGDTLRTRLEKIKAIRSIDTLDSLTGYQIIMVDTTGKTVRMLRGMPLRVLQWSANGGMEIRYKVMMILVPQFRPDDQGNLGVLHATAA